MDETVGEEKERMAKQQHLEVFRTGAAAWNAWKATQRADFVADLSDLFLENAILTPYDLRNADLRTAFLWRCSLLETDMQGIDLRQAHLWQCSLTQANLSGADLSNAMLVDCTVTQTNLSEANLRNARIIRETFRDVNLENTMLTGTDFIARHSVSSQHRLHRWWKKRCGAQRRCPFTGMWSTRAGFPEGRSHMAQIGEPCLGPVCHVQVTNWAEVDGCFASQ